MIISKKRITLILACVLISIIAAIPKTSKIQENIDSKTMQVTSTPATGKIIVIDAGHGTPDERS